jgi:peptidoglycan/LPS O-acetylase OafA/YrhL
MTYRPDIDGLRAIAVLAVVLCHAGLGFSGGFVGVDVFFVISGYLITRLMLKEIDAGTFSLVDFWERRIRRILPALAVVVGSSFVAGWFLLVPTEYHAFARSVVNLTLLQANVFFSHEVGYFAPAAEEKPLLHTWSLAVEEQFYLFVPLLVWGVLRLRGRKLLGATITLLIVLSFVASVYGTRSGEPTTYYALTARAWELFVGTATALVAGQMPIARSTLRGALSALGLAGIVIPCFVYDQTTPFPGWTAAFPVVGTALLIHLGSQAAQASWIHRALACRPLVAIGLISYSLYLWHWPLLVFLKRRNIVELTLAERLAAVGASLVLAAATYRLVEQPFRRRDFLASRKLVFGGAAAAFALLMIGGQAIKSGGGFPERLPDGARLFAATATMDKRFLREHTAADVPANLLRVGATDVEPRLLVWGDSHAMAVLPAIDELCRASGISARCAVHSGWPPILTPTTRTVPHHADRAAAFSAAVVDQIAAGKFDVVVLAGAWSLYADDPEFVPALVATVERLRASGVRVYFFKQVPKFSFDVAAALTRHAWADRDLSAISISPTASDEQFPQYAELLPQLASRGVAVLDAVPLLQQRGGRHEAGPFDDGPSDIRPFDAGGSFYRDAGHLSTHGALEIAPTFAPVVEALRSGNAPPALASPAPDAARLRR